MATYFHQFLRDESGLVITAELIMILTIAVISLTAGWGAVASMLSEELEDVANSVGSLNQSYNIRGISAPGHASCSGSRFNDSINLVNVSASSNSNASVACSDFTPMIPNLADAQVNLAGEPFVLIEEEYSLNARIDEALLVQLEALGIVSIREDGAVILLREDLVEIQADGSILILDDELRRKVALLQQRQSDGRIRARGSLTDQTRQNHRPEQAHIKAENRELNEPREEVKSQSNGNSDELRQENARLRKLIERLGRETQSR